MGIISQLQHRTPKTQQRMYQSAKNSRLTSGWGNTNSSADTELISSLRPLRSRSRALIRDAAYAKRAKVIVVNNVIGSGIGMQAQVMTSRDQLNNRVNDEIEEAWEYYSYAENFHTGGTLCVSDFERVAMGQVFEAGEVFNRKYYRPFGNSEIPFALELIEAERVVDEFQPSPMESGARVRMGVETDEFHRPLGYWIRKLHPGELRLTMEETDRLERVPADLINHLRIVDRWPQTRGEPWMHAVIRKLNDMDGYSEAEIIAARGAASYMATIESPNEWGDTDPTDPTAQPEIVIEPGIVQKLAVGDKMNFISPNRPNANMDPFMRLMLREVAAGVGTSYESLSRDYSQSNYSSSRLALLDDRDLWRMLQLWFIRSFRIPLHREWLRQAVLSRQIKSISIEEYALNPRKFEAVRFKPRGWSWIDPKEEEESYKQAVRDGFMTVSEVISITGSGRDLEDVLNERRRELDMMKAKGLQFDTDPERDSKGDVPPPVKPDQTETDEDSADRFAKILGNSLVMAARAIRPAEITINTPDVRVENKIDVPTPNNVINFTPPETVVNIENRIEIPPETDVEPDKNTDKPKKRAKRST
jgi:lambda family phage portal protein